MPTQTNRDYRQTEPGVEPPAENGRGSRPELSGLPEYPQFTPLGREHKGLLQAAFEEAQPEISEFTFAYKWIWSSYTHCRLTRFRGAIMLLDEAPATGKYHLLPPLIANLEEAVLLIPAALKEARDIPAATFSRVPQALAERLAERNDISVTEERERADYVYAGEELRQLPGRLLHRKRNHTQQFRKTFPGARYRDINPSLAEECAEFCRGWLEKHPQGDLPGLRREVETTIAMLTNHRWLGLRGGALVSEGSVVAFALGEPLNQDTFVTRVEKADSSFPGAYAVINQEFARQTAAGFKWINREQDLGLPGLRQAKKSYYPHHLLRKYQVRLA